MNITSELITAVLGFFGAFIIREVWDHIKAEKSKKSSTIDETMAKNIEAINNLNLSILELKLRIDHLTDKLQPVPKMAQDINEAHNKIREVNNRMELIQGAIK